MTPKTPLTLRQCLFMIFFHVALALVFAVCVLFLLHHKGRDPGGSTMLLSAIAALSAVAQVVGIGVNLHRYWAVKRGEEVYYSTLLSPC